MLIGDFFDGVGVLLESFVNLIGVGDDLFKLSGGPELFFLFFPSDGISLSLLVFFFRFALHEVFVSGKDNKRINKIIMIGFTLWSYKNGTPDAIRCKCFNYLHELLILLQFVFILK